MSDPDLLPLRMLVLSFLILILLGTGLLLLPFATPADQPIGVVDALFTATSATCVTGLVVRDTGLGFTVFGQVVILGLIQLGGIGIMTFSLLVMSALGGRLSLSSRTLLHSTLAGAGSWGDLWPLLRLAFRLTLMAEALGALVLFAHWHGEMGYGRAAWMASFHAVSAFCNAGFSLWESSLMGFRGDVLVNLVIMTLIVVGGLGYLTLFELQEGRGQRRGWSLHTRLVVGVSGALIVLGAAGFWLLERHHTLAPMMPGERLLVSLFQSVTARTAGFNTVDFSTLAPGTLFLVVLLMFVGGSPGSTAGGIKTTTLGVLLLAVWGRLRHRTHVNAFGRTVSPLTVRDALTVTLAGMFTVILGLFALLLLESPQETVVEQHAVFVELLFEVVSASATVGLSTGITSLLDDTSRLLITLLMFLGRLGPLTVAVSVARSLPARDVEYAEERVMVG